MLLTTVKIDMNWLEFILALSIGEEGLVTHLTPGDEHGSCIGVLAPYSWVRLADPDVASNPSEYQKLAKSIAELEEVVQAYQKYKNVEKQLQQAKDLEKEPELDQDMAEMVADEISMLSEELSKLEQDLKESSQHYTKHTPP
eukprot:Gb_39517 [translate_table: standard]